MVPQGPGLAIRIIGDVTREKLDILRQADVILIDELHKNGIYREIAQVRTNLPPAPPLLPFLLTLRTRSQNSRGPELTSADLPACP